jgi:hypothetical protein
MVISVCLAAHAECGPYSKDEDIHFLHPGRESVRQPAQAEYSGEAYG